MHPATTVLLHAAAILLVCVVITLTVFEWARMRRGRSLLDRSQLWLRSAGALLLSVLIFQVLGGISYVRYQPDPGAPNPRAAAFFLGYWMLCGMLTLVLLIIVRVDFMMLQRRRLEEERKLAREQLERPVRKQSDGASPESSP